jgi:hypothetical protein
LKQEAKILRDLANWREPAARIEKVLLTLLEKNQLTPPNFRPTYFAGFVARCAIGDGDYETALRMLRIGLSFAHDQSQLLYLTRVLDRIIPPQLLEELKRRDAERSQSVTSR